VEIYELGLLNNFMSKTNILSIIFLSLMVLASRLWPHWPNFSPLASVILFTAVYGQKKKYLLLPLAALLLSDVWLGFYQLSIMFSVYGSFLLIALLGLVLKKYKNPLNTISASLASGLIFFLVTNGAVWYFGDWYGHDLNGLTLCYTLAIPFFKATLWSNLLYTPFLFGLYELGRQWQPKKSFITTK
jgi:hypothetical protein